MQKVYTIIQKILNLKTKGETMKSKFILFAMFLFIFLPFLVYGYTQKSTLAFRDDIISILEQQAKNTFGNDYVVSNYVILDSVIGKEPTDVEMEDILDPYKTLAGIIIFSTYTEESPEEQYFCFFKNNSIIWYYEDKIGYWWGGKFLQLMKSIMMGRWRL